jgi:hypothetical protein
MVSATLVLGSFMTVLEGLSYLVVAALFGQRRVGAESRVSAALFQSWWNLIGANKIIAALAGLGAVYGVIDAPFYIAIIYFNVVILCLSLWCLLSYLTYLVTGRRSSMYLVSAFYLAYYLLLTYHIAAGAPTGVEQGPWRTSLVSRNVAPPLRQLVVFAGLVLPQTIAAFAYFGLVFRVHDGLARWRLLWVSASILCWTVSIFLVSYPGFDHSAVMQVGSRMIGVGSAFLGLLAYRPPLSLQRQHATDPGATQPQ